MCHMLTCCVCPVTDRDRAGVLDVVTMLSLSCLIYLLTSVCRWCVWTSLTLFWTSFWWMPLRTLRAPLHLLSLSWGTVGSRIALKRLWVCYLIDYWCSIKVMGWVMKHVCVSLLQALSTACWSVLKAKRRLLMVSMWGWKPQPRHSYTHTHTHLLYTVSYSFQTNDQGQTRVFRPHVWKIQAKAVGNLPQHPQVMAIHIGTGSQPRIDALCIN